MPPFLIDHIDSLLVMFFGVVFTLYAFLWDRDRWTRRSSGEPLRNFMALRPQAAPPDASTERREHHIKLLRICGPILFLSGVIYFITERPHPPVPQQVAPAWQRASTDDGRASAEFPQLPQVQRRTERGWGGVIDTNRLVYNDNQKEISFNLLTVPIQEAALRTSNEDRIEYLKATYARDGFIVDRVASIRIGDLPGYAIDYQKPGGKYRLKTRIAFVGNKIYQVFIDSYGKHHDDPMITRFLESFRIGEQPARHSN